MFTLFCTYGVLALIFLFLWVNIKRPGRAPGPLRVPLLGTLVHMVIEHPYPHIALDKISRKYGEITSIKMGLHESVVLSSYKAIKQIFSKEDSFDRQRVATMHDRSFRKNIGMAFSNGSNWVEIRKFSKDALKDHGYGDRKLFQNRFEYEMQEFFKAIEESKIKMNLPTNEEIDIIHIKRTFYDPTIMNSILTLLMGERFPRGSLLVKTCMKGTDKFARNGLLGAGILTAFPFLRFIVPKIFGYDLQMIGLNMIFNVAKDLLKERKAVGVYKTNPRCFIDEYLLKMETSDPKIFSLDQFQTLFADLLQASYETTSCAVAFIVLLIATHTEVQDKLYEEIERVCGINRSPQLDDRQKYNMPYTQAVILESLRWARVVVLGVPRMARKDIHYERYIITKGTVLIANSHSVCFDEEFWGDPNVFRPERFLDDENNMIQRKTERVLPFGVGGRNCFGEGMARDTLFLFTTILFQRYSLTIPPGYPFPDIEPILGVTLSPTAFTAKLVLRYSVN